MIDGVTIKHICFHDKDLFNSRLDFFQTVNLDTGETKGDQHTRIDGLIFSKTDTGTVKMRGSLHKYKNNGLHNIDNFTFKEVCRVVNELEKVYGIDIHKTEINTFEFGLNITLGYKPNLFLKHLLSHKNTRFNRETTNGNLYYIAKHQDFNVKLYAKSNEVLRFEIKSKRKKYLKLVRTLSDLTNKQIWNNLHKILLKEFENIIYYDNLKEHTPQKVKQYIIEKQNLPYLETRKRNKYKELNKYKKLLKQYGKNNFWQIKEYISEKYNELVNSDVVIENGCRIPDFANRDNKFKMGANYPTSKQVKNPEKVQITILDKLVKCTPYKCKVTGLDISMQKKGSRFLSISGVEFYQIHNPEIYRKLEKRLSNKWENKSIEIRNREIAHSIRNEYFNRINNTKRSINRILSMPSLFNNMDFISHNKLKLAGMN